MSKQNDNENSCASSKPIRLFRPLKSIAPETVPPVAWGRLEVILKVSERCNIDCTYCYFFHGENQDYTYHAPYISQQSVDACVAAVRDAARQAGISRVSIAFHGGEPMMLKKERFDAMCVAFREGLAELQEVQLLMQTNAMLVDAEWIEILKRHQVHVGVSIDGPRDVHDKHRLDHQGRGTYDRTVQGIRLLQSGLERGVGAICVIDPEYEPEVIFRHLIDDLQLSNLNFVLPMHDHDSMPEDLDARMAGYISRLFTLWREHRDKISIHVFKLLLALVSDAKLAEQYADLRKRSALLTISSDGDLGPNDDVRNTFPELFSTGANVHNSALLDYLNSQQLRSYAEAVAERNDECVQCCWSTVCDGGDLLGSEAFRYRKGSGFRQPSIYCHTIQRLLPMVAELANLERLAVASSSS